MNIMQQPERDLAYMAQYQRPFAQMARLYFWFRVYAYVWQEDVAKISKVQGAPHNVNPARAITW